MGIEDSVVAQVTSGLDLSLPLDRLRAGHALRRAHALVAAAPAATVADLVLAITAEQAAVSHFVTQRLLELTSPTVTVSDPLSPAHLDLEVVSQLSDSTGLGAESLKFQKLVEYRTSRARWIRQITWEAATFHGDELWTTAGTERTLREDALSELLDRRLRVVERMMYNVNVVPTVRAWHVSGGSSGSWNDGNQMRLFEYPSVPAQTFEPILANDSNWQLVGDAMSYQPADNSPPLRLPDDVAEGFRSIVTGGGNLWVELRGSPRLSRTDALLGLFTLPRPDFRQRAWLFCDMVGVALALEALWFARVRRTGRADAFESVFAGKPGDYASLGPVISHDGARDLDILMADGSADQYFENTELTIDELQVGDFVVFWNSRFYSTLISGAWGSEYSYVMGIERDGKTGKVRQRASGPQIWLAGHGLATTLYNGLALELLDQIRMLLITLWAQVVVEVRDDPAISTTVWRTVTLRRWDPYEPFASPGAWWIEIPRSVWEGQWEYPSLQAAVMANPRSVAHQDAPGLGYNGPPVQDALYFPLLEPHVTTQAPEHDPWRTYLSRRAADVAFRPFSTALSPIAIDASLAPGLYYRGKQARIPVVRPRVRVS